jgi:hypothetical protein
MLIAGGFGDSARAGTNAEANPVLPPSVEAASPLMASEAAPNAEAASQAGACTPEFGSFSSGNWPPACWRPYGPSAPFNVPIPASPRLAPRSKSTVRFMRRLHWAFENDGSGNFVFEADGSRPVYWPRKSDPLVRVACSGAFLCQSGMEVRIPAGAQPQAGSDGHMTVVDQEHGLEYDFWQATAPAHGEMKVSAGNSIAIGPGTGTGLNGYAEAARLGLLGGLIRAPEMAAGRIEHALAITVDCVGYEDVWPSPATRHGSPLCRNKRNPPHFASLLQLNMSEAQIAATGAPRWQQTVMQAMAQYGMYVVDTNGDPRHEMSLIKEDDRSFTSFGSAGQMESFVKAEGGSTRLVGVPVPVSKLRVIDPCVPQRTC